MKRKEIEKGRGRGVGYKIREKGNKQIGILDRNRACVLNKRNLPNYLPAVMKVNCSFVVLHKAVTANLIKLLFLRLLFHLITQSLHFGKTLRS